MGIWNSLFGKSDEEEKNEKFDLIDAEIKDTNQRNLIKSSWLVTRAKYLGRQTKIDKALEDYIEAIKFTPDYAPAHRGLIFVYSTKGDFEKCEKILNDYSTKDVSDSDKLYIYQELIATYILRGENKKLTEHGKKMLKLFDKHEDGKKTGNVITNSEHAIYRNFKDDIKEINFTKEQILELVNENKKSIKNSNEQGSKENIELIDMISDLVAGGHEGYIKILSNRSLYKDEVVENALRGYFETAVLKAIVVDIAFDITSFFDIFKSEEEKEEFMLIFKQMVYERVAFTYKNIPTNKQTMADKIMATDILKKIIERKAYYKDHLYGLVADKITKKSSDEKIKKFDDLVSEKVGHKSNWWEYLDQLISKNVTTFEFFKKVKIAKSKQDESIKIRKNEDNC